MSYYGHDLNWIDCEMLALARIPVDLLSKERDLYRTKWFDYRRLHPVKATYLFSHDYQEIVRAMYEKTRDKDQAKNIRAFTPENIFECPELISFYRARQAFDELGVRYEFGLRFVMNKYIDRGWRFLPRPNQMLGEEVLLDVRDAWFEECRIRLQLAKDPWYLAQNYEAHTHQNDYQKWIYEQCKVRSDMHRPIGTLLAKGHLIDRIAKELCTPKTYSRARDLADSLK